MKKRTAFLLLIWISAFAHAQQTEDSIRYYNRALGEKLREHYELLKKDSTYKRLNENLLRLQTSSDSYHGFILSTHVAKANFNRLNEDLHANGFPSISKPMWMIGYGFSFKKNRRIFDLNVVGFGLPVTSSKDGETLSVSFTSFLEFIWGYDVLKSNRVNLYPYAGVGLRNTTLKYETPVQANAAPTGIFDVVQNNRSFREFVNEIGYQAGLGFEYVVSGSKKPGGIILFLKGGLQRAFKSKPIKIEGRAFDLRLEPGSMIFEAGFKFFGR